NVGFHLLHPKLLCRQVLHNTLPQQFPSPLCLLCSRKTETDQHFLYTCGIKWSIWTS
ncbi:hypothetical protein BDA99DRAFT_426932, partial [Phascolomyces articulosus]